jgi:hypothetical protein
MKRRVEASRAGGSWGKVLLSGLVGLGVPLVLRGVSRSGQRSHGSPVTVGAVAGVLGALLGGGFVRRTPEEPSLPASRPAPSQRLERVPAEPVEHHTSLDEAPEPRRGPNGRERIWLTADSEAFVH